MIIKFLSSSSSSDSSLSLELTHVFTINVGVSSFIDHIYGRIYGFTRGKEKHDQKICNLNKIKKRGEITFA